MDTEMKLDELEIYSETQRLAVVATAAIERAMEVAGLRRAQLAEIISVPKSRVTKVLDGETNITLKTLAQFGLACGVRWQFVGVKEDDPSIIVTAPELLIGQPSSPYIAEVDEIPSLICEDDRPHPEKSDYSLAA